ncbi:MAG: hypothetical protein ACYSTZ_12830, partial [Planctomycetota bacterium]
MNTGYEPYKETFQDELRAGCEWSATYTDDFSGLPKFIKGPVWAYWLKYMAMNDVTEIKHVVMPLRDLNASAQSRLDVDIEFMVDKEYVQMP